MRQRQEEAKANPAALLRPRLMPGVPIEQGLPDNRLAVAKGAEIRWP